MPKLAKARPGSSLTVKKHPVQFSFWPVYEGTRRDGLQLKLFATNPWAIIRRSINARCPAAAQKQALAFLSQAEYYFNAAKNSPIIPTRPVLFYYCFLNLAKSYVLTSALRPEYGYKAYHGLNVEIGTGGVELADSYLEAHPSKNLAVNVFDDFLNAVIGKNLSAKTCYPLAYLMPQILQGHRLWCEASEQVERFIAIDAIELKQNKNKQIWINIKIYEDNLTRLGLTHKAVLQKSGLDGLFREVRQSAKKVTGKGQKKSSQRRVVKFEMISPIKYTGRAADKLQSLVDVLAEKLWVNILSVPPYRKYYLYLAPPAEQQSILPQPLSIYAVFYYLSSVTRYRPHIYTDVVSKDFGAFIEEITWNLPNQFLYLMASRFARQEITKGAFV